MKNRAIIIFFWGGAYTAICEAISGGRGFSLGFLVGEVGMLECGGWYIGISIATGQVG